MLLEAAISGGRYCLCKFLYFLCHLCHIKLIKQVPERILTGHCSYTVIFPNSRSPPVEGPFELMVQGDMLVPVRLLFLDCWVFCNKIWYMYVWYSMFVLMCNFFSTLFLKMAADIAAISSGLSHEKGLTAPTFVHTYLSLCATIFTQNGCHSQKPIRLCAFSQRRHPMLHPPHCGLPPSGGS